MVTDVKMDPNGQTARHEFLLPVEDTASLTNAVIGVIAPGYAFKVRRVVSQGRAITGSVVVDLVKVGAQGLVTKGTLAISATAEKFKTTTIAVSLAAGKPYTKAATDNLVFSAAYTINKDTAVGSFWGAFLVQVVPSTGVVSTKAYAADQVFANEAAAIANLPQPDADKVALGSITVEAKADSKWTANTDDLTAASDCQHGNFYDAAPASVLTAPVTFASAAVTDETLSATPANLRCAGTDRLVAVQTSAGGTAAKSASLLVTITPRPLNGEV